MKDKLGGKIMAPFAGLRAKTCIYLTVDGSEDKKVKDTKRCVIKRQLKFENYKTVQEQLNLRIKRTIQKKSKLDMDSLNKNDKAFIKTIN